jgi:DNA-directed RNA polymerase subunit M/transcription elongation factor TFIIS
MSDWIYQNLSELELRQKGRQSIELSKCSENKNNIRMIEQLIYKLSVSKDSNKFNRKKYVCIMQEFIRDTCYLKNKTLNDIYLLYKKALEENGDEKIGWKSDLFEDAKNEEDIEINNLKAPLELKEEGFYTCPRCGLNMTRSFPVQSRRADEPTTEHIFCLNPKCRFKWVEY